MYYGAYVYIMVPYAYAIYVGMPTCDSDTVCIYNGCIPWRAFVYVYNVSYVDVYHMFNFNMQQANMI